MVTYEEALKTVLETVGPVEAEERSLLECREQVLAENVYSRCRVPRTDISSPDGYAVRSVDIEEAERDHPVTLRIIGTARAGCMPRRAVRPGTAMRVMTGSLLPKGADCVVRFEDTDEPEKKSGPNTAKPEDVRIYVSMPPGGGVQRAGSSVGEGIQLLPRGTVVGPAQISALASVGLSRIRVIRQPVVAVIATGDELIEPGKPLPGGKTYDCNTASIAALVMHYGGRAKVLGIARDRKEDLLARIRKGMAADLIITSGGVSKGDYDLVRLVMDSMGRTFFDKVKMGGASVTFGMVGNVSRGNGREAVPLIGLPGPQSVCLVHFETLVRPALLRMRGLQEIDHPVVEAIAMDSFTSKMGMATMRWTYLEQKNGKPLVKLNTIETLGVLPSIATANSLTMIHAGASIRKGDKVKVWPLDWRRPQFSPAHL